MIETFYVMIGGTILAIGLMEYNFRQVKKRTEVYLENMKVYNKNIKR